jgi:hypothetical protein
MEDDDCGAVGGIRTGKGNRNTQRKPDILIRFEVFTAVTMKNGVFWVVTPCGSCKKGRFGGT